MIDLQIVPSIRCGANVAAMPIAAAAELCLGIPAISITTAANRQAPPAHGIAERLADFRRKREEY